MLHVFYVLHCVWVRFCLLVVVRFVCVCSTFLCFLIVLFYAWCTCALRVFTFVLRVVMFVSSFLFMFCFTFVLRLFML